MAYNSDTLAALINSTFKTKWDASHPDTPLENSGQTYDDRMIMFESIAEALLSHLSSEVAGSIVVETEDHTHVSSVPLSGAHSYNGNGKHTHDADVDPAPLTHTVSIHTNL